ncbi:shikimate dehydrogenase [Sphingomonas sp. BIUV-7]|uniref:Shikimate dehydrogenase (NADP(+)) n=1 Tax=Sphingomonas natans TaxID=3063330 RepID=A0ABT8YCD2_9SPHN|nr:shikimate dehydrogenase [Sphingomonas sp. BIUV-7]MDO6415997.1 shikimate dehydrogenase [Sphingomonas sp. BIUV-7]
MTQYAEVIGDPIAHSKSPVIHCFWLKALGLDGDYRRTQVVADALPAFLARRRADPDWRGCNVTIPHKQAVLPLLDAVDPVAAKIGAVNTIVARDGRLIGYNSDAAGFLAPLRPWLDERHMLRTARIFGAGGAARAIAHGLWGEGFTLILAARRTRAAAEIAAGFDPGFVHVTDLAHFAAPLDFDWKEMDGRLDVVVNATSCGMTGQPPLDLDFSHMPPGAIVYDAVYAPLETPLLKQAKALGHPIVDGLQMLTGQARIAFRLLFDADPPADAESEVALRDLLLA